MALHRLYSYMVRPSGGTSEVDPPVPIPNTEVKRFSADDTALATVWENKSLPGGLSTTPPIPRIPEPSGRSTGTVAVVWSIGVVH